ncbi:MAG: hypothetical protein KJ906_02945 [Nanoarchaeota archaeon]|nr:hypothetical protein [Nanoarchaeota archaeon]
MMNDDKFKQYCNHLGIMTSWQIAEYIEGKNAKLRKELTSAKRHIEKSLGFYDLVSVCGNNLISMCSEDNLLKEDVQSILDRSQEYADRSGKYVEELSIKR